MAAGGKTNTREAHRRIPLAGTKLYTVVTGKPRKLMSLFMGLNYPEEYEQRVK